MSKQHPHFEIVKSGAGRKQFKGKLFSSNGNLVWWTEAYPDKRNVYKAIIDIIKVVQELHQSQPELLTIGSIASITRDLQSNSVIEDRT